MNDNETIPAKPRSRKKNLGLFAALAALALGVAAYYWMHSAEHESTDDAAIEAHVLPISSKVSGQIFEVAVDDNQHVDKGALLARIDPRDYQLKLDQARAESAAAKAEAARAAADAVRSQQLYERDDVSRQVYEKAVADAEVLKARAQLAAKKVTAAELDLANTAITAPEAGKVTRKNAEMRAFVQVGQPLMAIVTDEAWVVANFKETQLTAMRPGQKVGIKVDAFPGLDLRGHVDSIQSGTGARFSLLPAENATGNFVKVVQRVPVKIVFDEPVGDMMLVPGMSVTPTVHLK
ncbi:MAG TPA: HlyD family secretion protein [Elusimicrobiales bacterium]|nr:HlyD family secretion protein [Elusimicrobiales bacterium]